MPYLPPIIPAHDRETYVRAGVGRRAGMGRSPAVLVVDMCYYIIDADSPLRCPGLGDTAVHGIRTLLAAVRPLGVPVIYTTQRTAEPYALPTGGRLIDKAIPYDSAFAQLERPHQIVAEVAPLPGEVVLIKPKPSAFFATQLASLLVYHGVDTLIVTGAATSGCIRATVDHAAAYNYRVIVPEECVADRFTTSHQATLFDIDAFLGDVMPLAEVIEAVRTRRDEGV